MQHFLARMSVLQKDAADENMVDDAMGIEDLVLKS